MRVSTLFINYVNPMLKLGAQVGDSIRRTCLGNARSRQMQFSIKEGPHRNCIAISESHRICLGFTYAATLPRNIHDPWHDQVVKIARDNQFC